MYDTSDNFKSYAENTSRTVDVKIVIGESEYLKNSIVELEIEDSIISEEEFELGGCITSRMNLTLKTDDLIPNNAEMKVYMRYVLGAESSEWLPLGVFYIDSRSYQNKMWKFVCFDKLIVSQKYYDSALVFPNTMHQVLIELCYNLGITISSGLLESINLTYMINSKPDYGIRTYRDMIRFIASAHGKVAKLNKNGELEFRDFVTRTSQHTIIPSKVIQCEEINPQKAFTKLVFNYDSDLEPIILGEGDESTTLWAYNPYITVEMAESIFEAINGISYYPLSLSWFCRPDIETADFISVQTRETTYSTIILRNTLTFSGGMSANVISPSKTISQSEFGFDGTMGQQFAEVEKRIGLFAHTTNTSKKIIKQVVSQVALMPLTTATETDIEFVVTLNGIATVASILRITFRIIGSNIGREIRYPVAVGENLVSFSTLIKRLPKVSDWLFCRMVVDTGNFVIEKNECEFYIYGGNIISGNVQPITEYEDTLDLITIMPLGEDLLVTLVEDIRRNASDDLEISLTITDNLEGTVLI